MTYTDLLKRFTYHRPDAEKAKQHEKLREAAFNFAQLIEDSCPESREKSLALTKIEEAVMWGNAAIARHDVVM